MSHSDAGEPPALVSKILLLVVDGIGDVTVPQLGHRTPLKAARTPWLDAVAAGGLNGLMDPVAPGLACGSDTAHLSLLGYEPQSSARGRGAFEALGAGLDLQPGDVAFKANFAVVDDARLVTQRRADRNFTEEGPVLSAALDGLHVASADGGPDATLHVRYATEHRAGVLLRGAMLCDRITGTDPLKDNRLLLRAEPLDDSPEAAHTAHMVNQACDTLRATLRGHAVNAARAAQGKAVANVLLLRGPGSVLTEAPFGVRHSPLVAACVAPTRIIAGLALSLGITLIPAPGATGDYRTDLAAKAKAAAQALDCSTPHTFCLCHVKAVDDAGHDRNVAYRVAYLQAVDTMVGHLVKRLDAQQQQGKGARYVLCVTGDHSTPVLFGDHSHEPVPVALAHLADVIAAAGGPSALAALPLGSIATPEFGGPWSSATEAEPPQPQAVPPSTAPAAGDSVLCFDELSAARGGLGRFCGGELMTLLKGFSATQPQAWGSQPAA